MVSGNAKALNIISIIYFAAKVLITLPICIWSAIELRRHWNEQYIMKRRRGLVLLIFVFLCWHSFIEFPYFVITLIFNHSTALFSLFGVMYIFGLFMRTCTMSLFLLRGYLLYFDHEYESILSQKKWQILIDPDIEQTNWFLVNKKQHRFGSASYLTKYCILPICSLYAAVFVIALIGIHSIHTPLLEDRLGLLFTVIFCVIVTVLGFVVWRKYPKVLDRWGIRQEMGLSIKIFLVFPIVLAIDFMLLLFEVIDPVMTLCILFMGLDQCIAANVFVLVPYVTYKQNSDGLLSPAEKMLQSGLDWTTPDVKWQDFCQTNNGYEQFANFLESEFAVENILFITEYIQLKHVLLKKQSLRDLIVNELSLEYEFMIPESVPISLIVKELAEVIHEESVKDVVSRAIGELYRKYIDMSTAGFPVNINYGVRAQLTAVFVRLSRDYDNQSDEDIIRMFLPLLENAVEQVSSLLRGSQQRFRTLPVFKELILAQRNTPQEMSA